MGDAQGGRAGVISGGDSGARQQHLWTISWWVIRRLRRGGQPWRPHPPAVICLQQEARHVQCRMAGRSGSGPVAARKGGGPMPQPVRRRPTDNRIARPSRSVTRAPKRAAAMAQVARTEAVPEGKARAAEWAGAVSRQIAP